MPGPFDLDDPGAYARWRDHKQAMAPVRVEDLIVEVNDPRSLTAAENAALLDRVRRTNMAIYASRVLDPVDKNIPRKLGEQFGLFRLDANFLADDDGISSITAAEGRGAKGEFIPYTNRPIRWHTDGYYNMAPICGMLLHCAVSAHSGGENRLMDHEMAYIALRDENPNYIVALSAPDAMTIPAREDDSGVARPAQSGPVFSVDAQGNLHMRYTARTVSIEWRDDAPTRAALRALSNLLESSAQGIYRARLEPGMGLLCNNVLHDRAGFTDSENRRRLMFRARYFDRIADTDVARGFA
jgi:hypothetical protein